MKVMTMMMRMRMKMEMVMRMRMRRIIFSSLPFQQAYDQDPEEKKAILIVYLLLHPYTHHYHK